MVKNNDDNLMGMISHLLGYFTNWIGPLVMFLILKQQGNSSALENAKHSLNFQISMMIYYSIAGLLMFLLIGFVLLPLLALFALIVTIIAVLRSYQGEVYRYPLEIQFLK